MAQWDYLGKIKDEISRTINKSYEDIINELLEDNIPFCNKAIVCGTVGKYGEALQHLMKVRKERPKDYRVWMLMANYCEKMNLYNEVSVCLTNALSVYREAIFEMRRIEIPPH